MFFKMILVVLLFFSSLFTQYSVSAHVKQANITSKISVIGVVYCDICSSNSFSKHSYYIPGAEVKIDCKFNALSPRTAEQITFSVNRTTNRNGFYRLEIPAVDGIQCAEDSAIVSACEATLIHSSSPACSNPGIKTTTDHITVKSKSANLCIYSLSPLTYRPSKKDVTKCAK